MSEQPTVAGSSEDAGAAWHHWIIALVLGALFGGIAVLIAWLVMRALS